MKKNEIEKTAGPELEVCVKVKIVMISTVCNQPYPQNNQWEKAQVSKLLKRCKKIINVVDDFTLLQDPGLQMCGNHS